MPGSSLFFMKFVKNNGVFKFFHAKLVELADFVKSNKNANDFVTWSLDVVTNGFLISVSLAALFNYPWSFLLLAGSGFAHYLLFDMLGQALTTLKRHR
jgi:hypothetical protein